MADLETTLNSGVFGSERVPVPVNTQPGANGTALQVQDGPRVLLDDNRVAGDAGFREARAAREALQYKPESTFLEGVGAAVSQWDTVKLIERLGRPAFDNDAPINQFEALQEVPMVLAPEEREYMLEVGKGQESFKYALEKVKDRRMAQGVVGEHPIGGLVTQFMDPMWLAVPPSIRLGKLSPVAGRVAAGGISAGLGGAVTALGEGPVSDNDIALSMLMNGAAAAMLYKPGMGLVKRDVNFPEEQLKSVLDHIEKPAPAVAGVPTKPRVRQVAPAEFDAQGVKTKEAIFEEVPPELAPTALRTDQAQVVAAVDKGLAQEQKAAGVGSKIAWNMHKTMTSFGEEGKRIANALYDNNSDLSLTSIESHREAIMSDLKTHQYKAEDLLRQALKEDGYGTLKMMNPLTSREAYGAQAKIEREVQRELYRREQLSREGGTVPIDGSPARPAVMKIADELDNLHKRALKEMKDAGVDGAENILERPGYLNRRWSSQAIDQTMQRLEAAGLSRDLAHEKVRGLVSLSLRRANEFDKNLSDQIAAAIVDRAERKGYFEDSVFNGNAGADDIASIRDILKNGGMGPADIEKALERMRVKTDEKGKASFLKHRMDLDYKATMRIGNENVSIMDLIDGRVTSIVDQYVQGVSTQSAFARKGYTKRSDIQKMREALLHDTPVERRAEAKDLFDNSIAYLRGEPSGAKMNDAFRLVQAYGRTISLAWSGLWQATEYANIMAEYGLGKTLKYAAQEIPGFKQLMKPGKADARSLDNVLADHSSASMRIRPYLAKFEDGYEMDTTSALQLAAQPTGALVPYANAMKYVHHTQAKITGNLIIDRLKKAADGDVKAREALAQYGLESPVMDKLAKEFETHGFNVDSWDDKVWQATRPAFAKMMDASVLKGRMGDMPAFAAFDSVGKFVFTYRTFVLVAHNKVLAGGLERNGAGAIGLLMMYQMPLAMAAVQAQSIVTTGKTLTESDMTKKAMGQMGGLGLFSEPLKWAMGESNSVGAPALIPLDRGVKFLAGAAQGDAQQAGRAALSLLPVAAATPWAKALDNHIKE